MPVYWTAGMDAEVRRMRKLGMSYLKISKALGLTKDAVSNRAFRIGAAAVFNVQRVVRADPVAETLERDRDDRRQNGDAMPAFHPVSWGAINRPELLSGRYFDDATADFHAPDYAEPEQPCLGHTSP